MSRRRLACGPRRAARAWGAAALVGLGLLDLGRAAFADDSPPTVTKPNAISHKPLAILSQGLVLQYERWLDPVSVVAGSGLRAAARDDFRSVGWLTRTEARWWPLGREPITDFAGMGGFYLGVALDVTRTELESRSLDRSVGVDWTLAESLRCGYRFVLFDLLEITPGTTAVLVHDFDEQGRLAPTTRPTLGFDLTTGWLF